MEIISCIAYFRTKRVSNYSIINHFLFMLALAGPLSISTIFGQSAAKKTVEKQPVKLSLIARYYGDSAVLRWGFDAPFAWTETDKAGFIIERVELDDKNVPVDKAYRQVATVKSWSLEDFKNRMPRTDTLGMVAAQALHGKNFNLNGNQVAADNLKTQAEMSENRFRVAQLSADLSPRAAEGLGWRWVDRNVKANRKYIYRIYSPIPPNFFNIDTTGYILPTEKVFPIIPPQYFTVENGDKIGTLTWQHDQEFIAYWIEKSTDGINFSLAVNKPYVNFTDKQSFEMSFKDSLKTNYKPVFYRLSGITPFGEKSAWSKPQTMSGRDLTPPYAAVMTKGEIDRDTRKVTLEWANEPSSDDLKGFYVDYSKKADGVYNRLTTNLLSKSTRQYQTVWDKKTHNGFYKIIAVDTAGNEADSYFRYVFLPDLDPPSKPLGLKGKIDTNGVLRLTWTKPIEDDVQGYTIQFANALNHVFTPIGGDLIVDTVFTQTITLRTLTEKIYYRIAAVDMNQNISPFSEILQLKKPDRVKPIAPNFKDYNATDSTIFLSWHPSTSSDAVKQRLYRRLMRGTENAKMIAEMDNSVNRFTDIPPSYDLYTYTLETEDDDGLRSIDGDTLNLKLVENLKLKASPNLTAKFDEKTKTINLAWRFNGNGKIRFAIYKATANEPLQQIKMLDGQSLTFEDSKIKTGIVYQYAVKALDNENRESNLSETVKIKTDF
jgi:uncharacterized protein